MLRTILRWVLALFFISAGASHFLNPGPFLAMMPPWLPEPELMNWISGAAEIAGGLGVLIGGPLRRLAAWGLLALLVAVFPANVQVAMYGWPGVEIEPWVLWARLPFQPLLGWWVYWTCLAKGAER